MKKSKWFWPIFVVTFPLMIPIYLAIFMLYVTVGCAWLTWQLIERLTPR